MKQVETLIIGGGQAGLATSYWLTQFGREHLVLERADRPGNAWRQRWDSFTLVTPNWSFLLPGAEYDGDDPDGFMLRDDVIETFERYVSENALPVRYGIQVVDVSPSPDGRGYRVHSVQEDFEARNVVVATGLFQRPKIPAFAYDLPPNLLQLASGEYNNPATLPSGAVLVVGSGQSGCQIAEELYKSGRRVYLSIGGAGRAPRRYRGKDIYRWLSLNGYLNRTADMLPTPAARFMTIPHVSGAGGGHDLNLHKFARDGVTLLGHVRGADDGTLFIAPDRNECLAKSDQLEGAMLDFIDAYIARMGLDAPGERPPLLRDGFDADIVTELSLGAAGISSVIWAAGYAFDFNLVKLPVTDSFGLPIQQHGVTAQPGLYFAGLPWMNSQKSGLLLGVGEQTRHIAAAIASEV
ncbi:MAG: NAD(P)-binding domain-containing protein [Caldilineales bacterium]|nr:NAD(P)-binding domain-containing protein [Caldilineales bacterium]